MTAPVALAERVSDELLSLIIDLGARNKLVRAGETLLDAATDLRDLRTAYRAQAKALAEREAEVARERQFGIDMKRLNEMEREDTAVAKARLATALKVVEAAQNLIEEWGLDMKDYERRANLREVLADALAQHKGDAP